MRTVLMFAVLCAACAPVPAGPPGSGAAATLSAMVGGSLDSDLGENGALSHEPEWSSIPINPGRSVQYRRRVALDRQQAETSTLAAARLSTTARTAN